MEYQTVHLFVCQGFSDWEPSYVLPMLNDPTRGSRVQTVGVSREPVKTSGGVTIVPDMTLAELEPAQSALLILPGSDGWAQGKYPETPRHRTLYVDGATKLANLLASPELDSYT